MSLNFPFSAEKSVPPALLATVTILAVHPFVADKYVFLLDFVVGPEWGSFTPRLFGFRTSAYGGSLPLSGVLSAVAGVAGADVAAKLLLAGTMVFVAASGYVALPGGPWPRLYGALVLLVNPFVYTRLLVGHWAVVWGLAAFPLALKAYGTYVDRGRYRDLLLTVGAITLLGFNAHLLYASTFLLSSLTLIKYAEQRTSTVVRRGFAVALVAVPVNAYWLVPVLLADSDSLANVSSSDIALYAPHADSSSVLYATATMHGFWRNGYVYAKDLVPPVQTLYVVILFLTVYGAVTHIDDQECGDTVKALLTTAVVALLLGAGVSGPAAPVFRWLFEHAPFFSGLRDANKLVALLVIAYAYLGSLGVAELLTALARFDWNQMISMIVVLLVVLAPLLYTFPMITGYAGQVNSQEYPEEWHEVKSHLNQHDGDYNVLFLPWHQYMNYSWSDGRQQRISTPARQFFSKPVIQGDNVEIGPVYSTSDNPVSRYVEFLFGLGPNNERRSVYNMGELLAQVNVEYVLVTKEADWRYYDAILRDQRDLSLILENDHFRVYRNERRVHRSYATNQITYVRNLSHFVVLSESRNVTGVYGIDRSKAGRTEYVGDPDQEHLDVKGRWPVHYRVDGTTRDYTVFRHTQRTGKTGWRYNGDPATLTHLGFQPVFESQPDGGNVRFSPFYRLYLPSYLLSILAVVLLIWYERSNRSAPTTKIGLWRRTKREKSRKSDNHDR